MDTFVRKTKMVQQTLPEKKPAPGRVFLSQNRDVRSILHPQQNSGNKPGEGLLQAEAGNGNENVATSLLTQPHNGGDQVPVRVSGAHTIQAKLKVGAPGDQQEQEADRVAEQVMRQNGPEGDSEGITIQASPSPQTVGVGDVNEGLENQLNRSKGAGSAIPDRVRAIVEPRMQFDFSSVNLHTSSEAAEMNEQLGARAFTHGHDIYFGSGEYNPDSAQGKRLLAHELTHVVQQSASTSHASLQRAPLLDQGRRDLNSRISRAMAFVHSDFDDGAILAENDIRAQARANADAIKALFGIAMALIVPGVGGLVAGSIASRIGMRLSTETATIVGGAIGEMAKNAGNSAVDQAFARNPRSFFTTITSGLEASLNTIQDWLQDNIENHIVLPDTTLMELADYWRALAANNEAAEWATWFVSLWTRFENQVEAIGPQGVGMVPFGPSPQSNDNIPVHIQLENGQMRLGLVNKTRVDYTQGWEYIIGRRDIRTRYRFLRWIDNDLAAPAIARAQAQRLSVPTLSSREIAGVR